MSATNVDTDEVQKFSKLHDEWWNETGAFSSLHHINPLRMDFILKQADLKNKTILDVGCGGGILCEALAKAGGNITGIDLSQSSLNTAKNHQANLAINYILSSIEDFAENNSNQFDIITCMELLEHVPDPNSIISACYKLLKPNGKLFLSTINRNLKSYLFAIVGAEIILKLLPKNTHDYAKFIKPSELSQVLRDNNFSVKDIAGITYNPLSKEYCLNTDISVNYLVYVERQF